jgi:hypothetical protein
MTYILTAIIIAVILCAICSILAPYFAKHESCKPEDEFTGTNTNSNPTPDENFVKR